MTTSIDSCLTKLEETSAGIVAPADMAALWTPQSDPHGWRSNHRQTRPITAVGLARQTDGNPFGETLARSIIRRCPPVGEQTGCAGDELLVAAIPQHA